MGYVGGVGGVMMAAAELMRFVFYVCVLILKTLLKLTIPT